MYLEGAIFDAKSNNISIVSCQCLFLLKTATYCCHLNSLLTDRPIETSNVTAETSAVGSPIT